MDLSGEFLVPFNLLPQKISVFILHLILNKPQAWSRKVAKEKFSAPDLN